MAEDAPATQEEQKPKPKLPIKTIIIILGVLLLEGGAISLFFIMKGGPTPAEGSDPIEQTQEAPDDVMAEIALAQDFQVVNYTVGTSRIMVTLDVVCKVKQANKDKLQAKVTEHEKEILSAIRTLVSAAQPEQIKDPLLRVMERQIKTGVEEIVGEELIEKILIPRWIPYMAD